MFSRMDSILLQIKLHKAPKHSHIGRRKQLSEGKDIQAEGSNYQRARLCPWRLLGSGRTTCCLRQACMQKWLKSRAEMCKPRQAVLMKSSIWKACGLCMPMSHSFKAGTCYYRHPRKVWVTFSSWNNSTLLLQMKPTITCYMMAMPRVIMFIVPTHCGMLQYPSSHSRLAIRRTKEKPVKTPLNSGAGAAAVKYFFTSYAHSQATPHPLLGSLERWNSETTPSATSIMEALVVVMGMWFAAKKVLVSIWSICVKNSPIVPSFPQSSALFQKSYSSLNASLQCSSLAHLVAKAALIATIGTPYTLEMRQDLPQGERQISSYPLSMGESLVVILSLVMGQFYVVFTQQPLHKTSSSPSQFYLLAARGISCPQN